MSKFVPSAVNIADMSIAQAPYYGGEFAVYLTNKDCYVVGTLTFSAAATATYAANATVTITNIKAAGTDLQAVLEMDANLDAPLSFWVRGTNASDAVCSGVALFTPPTWAENQSYAFPQGYAVDVDAGVNKFKTVTGISLVQSGSRNLKVALMSLPETTDFALVGCTNNSDFTTKARPSKPIPCGMDGAAFNKKGRSEPGTLKLGANLISMGDGLMRYDGVTCTAMLVGIKEDAVMGDRVVLSRYIPKVSPKLPEGDALATLEADGNYQRAAYFVAP